MVGNKLIKQHDIKCKVIQMLKLEYKQIIHNWLANSQKIKKDKKNSKRVINSQHTKIKANVLGGLINSSIENKQFAR